MSIATKKLFADELRDRLADDMTVSMMAKLMDALDLQFAQYDLERNEADGEQQEFDEILKLFLDTKSVEGRSEKTLQRYSYAMKRFREKDKTPIRNITVQNLRNYLSEEKARGISSSTLQGNRDVYLSFFGWAHREGLIPSNPTANLNPIKCKKEVRHPYSDVDIERLKESCTTLRDKAMILFLLSTGCRISEVCGLNRNDVDFHALECTVLGKGNKERTVYMDDVAAMQLQNYLRSRTDSNEALFVGKGAKRLQPGGVRQCLEVIGKRAGVENVHPHRFRRTLATNLIHHGMPVQEVAAILGHEKLDTTMKYVYMDRQNVKSSYKKYS